MADIVVGLKGIQGKMTVGTAIKINHLAAAPLGAKVRAEGYLKLIQKRKLIFDVVVFDDFEKISEGENEHIIVSADNFLNNLIGKQGNLIKE